MPADEYAAARVGGALKLKGAKVAKPKKKKKAKAADDSTALALVEAATKTKPRDDSDEAGDEQARRPARGEEPAEEKDDESFTARKTDAELRFEEAKRKKVSREPL